MSGSFVSLSLLPFLCLPFFVSLHLSPFIFFHGLVGSWFFSLPFCLLSFVSLHLFRAPLSFFLCLLFFPCVLSGGLTSCQRCASHLSSNPLIRLYFSCCPADPLSFFVFIWARQRFPKDASLVSGSSVHLHFVLSHSEVRVGPFLFLSSSFFVSAFTCRPTSVFQVGILSCVSASPVCSPSRFICLLDLLFYLLAVVPQILLPSPNQLMSLL